MKTRRFRSLWLSAFFCAAIWLVLFQLLSITPFGGRTLLTIDAYHQYAPFHAELRRKILEGGSIFYGWTNGLGKDFLGQTAYYTMSPLSLLPLLFPEDGIIHAMQLMLVLKSLLATVSAAYCLIRLDEREESSLSPAMQAILALCYSFSGFFAAFYWNVMWLDAMALLPLILLGLYELSRGLGRWRFLLGMAACLVTNYFMGVVVLLCSLPIYAALLIPGHSRREWHILLRRLGRFAASLLLAIGLSAFVLSPALGSLEATDALGLGVENPFHFFSRPADAVAQQLMGAEPQVVVVKDAYANSYSGLLPLLLLPLYFALKGVSLKQKLCTGGLLLLFYLCMNNALFDYIVHGFHINKGLPHRFAFVYTALLVLMARRVLIHRRELSPPKLGLSLGGIAVVSAYSLIIAPNLEETAKLSTELWFLNLLLLALYSAILLLMLREKSPALRRVLPWVLLLLAVGELGYNQLAGIRHSRTNDIEHYSKGSELIADFKSYTDDEGFYRMEVFPSVSSNDAVLYGFKGMASFTSIINLNTAQWMHNLGYPGGAVAYGYADNTPLMTSLLGLRYISDRVEWGEGYSLLGMHASRYFYENDNVLPLGFAVSRDSLSFSTTENSDPFTQQNELATALSGAPTTLLYPAAQTGFAARNIVMEALPEGRYHYSLIEPESLSAQPVAELLFTATYTGEHWLSVDALRASIIEVSLPSHTEYLESGKINWLYRIGRLNEGDTVSVRLQLLYRNENERYFAPEDEFGVYLAGFDDAAFAEWREEIGRKPLVISDYGDNFLNGSVTTDGGDVLFMSIPFGSGWRATVDGESVKPIAMLDKAFLALELPAGEHSISLSYETPNWQRGLIISALSLLILAAWIYISNRGKKWRTQL